MRNLGIKCLALVTLGLAGCSKQPAHWEQATLEVAARIPLQHEGRVKPIDTVARFQLLAASSHRSLKVDGARLPAIGWMLDCLLRSDRAEQLACFDVPTTELLDAIEVPHDGRKRRDHYSFNELAPGLDRLYALANEYRMIETKKRSRLETQILRLGSSVYAFERLTRYLDGVRARYPVSDSPGLKKLFSGRKEVRLSDLLAKGKDVWAIYEREAADAPGKGHEAKTGQAMTRLLRSVSGSTLLDLVPPPASDDENAKWLNLADLVKASLNGKTDGLDAQYAIVERLEAVTDKAGDEAALRSELESLRGEIAALAAARHQGSKVELEVAYYEKAHLHWSQGLFGVAFFVVVILWLFPRSRPLRWLALVSVFVPLVFLILAIIDRCIIRGRPPITGLYETTLFTTAVAVAAALIAELINRRRIAVSVAALLGFAGMFLANRYEAWDAVDTMPTLPAVLDTNFWLATHVTCVVAGYGASLFAAALAHVWLIGRFIGWIMKRLGRSGPSRDFFQITARMTYGVVGFALIFSVVGTILGGVWANDSWGRFWGWDPKENGALMICLWQLVILHARLGGFVRHMGFCALTVVLGMITAFSWWGVNELGVGLHSYGFTDGVMSKLITYWGIEGMVLAGVCLSWILARVEAKQTATTPARGRGAGEAAVKPQDRIAD